MRQRSSVLSAVASMGAMFLLSLTSVPAMVKADLTCAQFGSDTFRVGSTVKFQWTDTLTTTIDTFTLDLYCFENSKLVQTITSLNSTSPVIVPWIVNSTLSNFKECPLNQYQGAFGWTYSDPDTGASVAGKAPCKIMLFVSGNSQQDGMAGGDTNNGELPEDDPRPSEIVVSDKTKSIVIGVGCAVGALVVAGFVGFYVIRHKNKRAAQDQISRKLREPIQSGPLFPDGAAGGGAGGAARASRYNELTSVTTGSVSTGSPGTLAPSRTEMVEMTPYQPTTHYGGYQAASSRPASPAPGAMTPIAAAHAKLLGSATPPLAPPAAAAVNAGPGAGGRPTSLLTSSFVPPPDHARPLMEQSQQDLELFRQQQQLEHQLNLQHQQQQQQQQYSYPY